MAYTEIIPVEKKNPLISLINTKDSVDLQAMTIENKFLPYIFFARDGENEDCLVIKESNERLVEKPDIIHVYTREMTRDFNGQKYCNRVYKPLQTEDSEAIEKWEKQIENSKSEQGYNHLLLIKVDGEWKFATFETFGALFTYWLEPLKKACLKNKQKIKVSITNHSSNKKTSKKGFAYFDCFKFSQWSFEAISSDEMQEILGQYKKDKEKIDYFLNQ